MRMLLIVIVVVVLVVIVVAVVVVVAKVITVVVICEDFLPKVVCYVFSSEFLFGHQKRRFQDIAV